MDSRPSWQRKVENGTIGEARTKALLLERFWILERSIDAEGADFIIQRRLSQRTLLDPRAPKLGYVQVKFYQDRKTRHFLPKEYVVDDNEQPFTEFFLICHTGSADEAELYFLDAEDIHRAFRETLENQSRPNCYVIPGYEILIEERRVASKFDLLNTIEKALVCAEFARNRRLLRSLVPEDSSFSISSEFTHNIGWNARDISTKFFAMREHAVIEAKQLVKKLEFLTTIANTDDPVTAADAAEQLAFSLNAGWESYSEDFHRMVLSEKTLYDQLVRSTRLNDYLELRGVIRTNLVEKAKESYPFSDHDCWQVEISYYPSSMKLHSISVALIQEEISSESTDSAERLSIGIESDLVTFGHIRGFIRWGYFKPERWKEDECTVGDKVASIVDILLSDIMRDVLACWSFTSDEPYRT